MKDSYRAANAPCKVSLHFLEKRGEVEEHSQSQQFSCVYGNAGGQ